MGDSGDAGARTKAQEQQGKQHHTGDAKEDIGSKLEGVQGSYYFITRCIPAGVQR